MTEPRPHLKPSAIRGPRPMALHLQNSLTLWQTAPGGLARLGTKNGFWHPAVAAEAAALADAFAGLDDTAQAALQAAVETGAGARAQAFLRGINAYLTHPYTRPETQASVALRLGGAELLDYGGDGQPLLMIPSLINPYYILDLKPGRSLAAYLKARGFRPFIVNWGEPGAAEQGFETGAYVMERLVPFLRHVAGIAGAPVPVIGNCMGGTLALALAARAGGHISRLALLATPWDFADSLPHAGRKYAPMLAEFMTRLPETMPLPVDALQSFFTSVDPSLSSRKFRRFAAMDKTSEAAEFFVAMETWANTGAPLARPVAEECLVGWYRNNKPGRIEWQVDGRTVNPADITCPVWVAGPTEDRLVPQASAFGILKHLKNAESHAPGAGHVGMLVGSKAESGLWAPLHAWLLREGS
ncbi:alpha/beta fold hydrolase [Kordiimonas marina]|uniref:alpha/beta fold hydrolase n=1 Tax=Kordiimonas marina TaxID=2872312 RepID=UPI001FF53A1A|nr:alpha/beta fold hydrolase [Kordiimonas marina]MCJ9428394.1 alpha/beta fold hydrolase [Kordiimonas marina]